MKVKVPTDSFFNFFSPPKVPAGGDDDAASDIEERLELDYTLGEDIKEKLIPRAVDWFTGEALQFEEYDEEMDMDDFDDDDEDDDDDDDDDDEDRRTEGELDDETDEEVGKLEISIPIQEYVELTQIYQDDGTKPKKEAAECKQS